MCGIAAIHSYDAGAVDEAELGRMSSRMVSRGPDGEGVWYDPDRRVGMAHRRLSIIDLSETGAQPMCDVSGRYLITFNGEIYNYRALRDQLERKGYRFRSTSDTEVLLNLYAESGEKMVEFLRGMFAFAIWDSERKRLFAARDPYGIKPLYYSDNGRELRLASQVKALLAGGGVDDSPEPAGHVGLFLWGHVPEPFTLYRGIRALPAGSTLRCDRRGVYVDQYANMTALLSQIEPFGGEDSGGEMAESVRESLRESVEHHLIADVEVGVFLSAGIDSATLAALASEQRQNLRTITLGFEEFAGTEKDEVPLAEEIAARYGTRHTTVRVKRSDFADAFEKLLDAMDQPSNDGVNTYFVSKAAADAGLKVAISGLGGDELFGGYPSFREIPKLVRFAGSIPQAHRLGRGFRWISAPIVRRLTSPKFAGLFEYGHTFGGAYLLRRGMYMPWELPRLLDGDLVRDGWRTLQPLQRLDETTNGVKTDRLRVTALESCWYMRNQLLRDTDWASMAHSLEVRVPLVDWKLLGDLAPALASARPPEKRDLAASARPPLPNALMNRPKSGFSVPVRDWLLNGQAGPGERGLRGWVRLAYERQVGTQQIIVT